MSKGPLSVLDHPRVAEALVAIAFAIQAITRAITPVTDQDSFWIAATGRWTLAHGIPHENIFSFTAPASPWICHELGFALLYAKGLAAMGPAFFNLVGIVAGAITLAIAARFVTREVLHGAVVAIVLLTLVVEVPLFHPRPPFAALGFFAAMIALAFSEAFDLRRAAACVALEWVWTSCHGSFPLGVVVLVVAAIDHVATRRMKVVTAAVATVVTFVNPYGAHLHGLVARYAIGGDATAKVIHEHILEFLPLWKAPTAFGPFDAFAVALVTLLALVAIGSRGGRDRVRGAFVLVLAALAVHQVRNVHVAVLAAVMLLARVIDTRLPPAIATRTDAPSTRASHIVGPGALVAFVIGVFVLVTRPREAMLGPNVGGSTTLALVDHIPDGARVASPFGISPLVMWYAFPRGVRVLYDARNDCYPPHIALAALPFEYDEDAQRHAAATVEIFGANYAITRKNSLIETSFMQSPAWHLVEVSGALTLFAHR